MTIITIEVDSESLRYAHTCDLDTAILILDATLAAARKDKEIADDTIVPGVDTR